MAVKERKGEWYIYFKPFGKKIWIKVDASGKREAQQIEGALLRALRTGCYGGLDPVARETCIRLFTNQKWELPDELGGYRLQPPNEALTLWKAFEHFLRYPEIRDSKERPRYEQCILHLTEYFGKERAVKAIWVPEIKEYMAKRLEQGAAASTVNREKGTLSKLFQVLVEYQLVEANPVRLVKNLSQKGEERQAYVALEDVERIAARCPAWYRPLIWTAYFSGMRRGEILGLTRKQVNLSQRMIRLGPQDTQEGHWKRVPIHSDLVPILEKVLNGPSLISGKVFPLVDEKGIRDIALETFKNPWERACLALEMQDPLPRFHDLRHTWRANARRSGMDPDIAEGILGHWNKGRAVNQRYGYVDDQELIRAIDRLTFNHGDTTILVARMNNDDSGRKGSTGVARPPRKEKRSCCHMT
jgi:integrase